MLADKFQGKPLNSPNDIVVKSDDSIWFTDPPFGILGHYEGTTATPELPTNIYRLDARTRELTAVTPGDYRPNGLAFSPDESKLYVVECLRDAARDLRLRRDRQRHQAANKRTFITAEAGGTPDGFRLDTDGNLWCGWGMGNAQQDGVKVFDPTGKPIGFIAAARALRQRRLRRREAQPAVHDGEPLALFALREHAGREGRLIKFLHRSLAFFQSLPRLRGRVGWGYSARYAHLTTRSLRYPV